LLSTISEPNRSPPPTSDTSVKKGILSGDYLFKETVKFDKSSGKQATHLTPPWMTEEKVITQIHSILHWVDIDNPRGKIPTSYDSQYGNWEEAVLKWAQETGYRDILSEIEKEKEYDDRHTPEKKPRVSIKAPSSNTVISGSVFPITLTVTAPLEVDQVDFFLDSKFLASRSYTSKAITSSILSLSLPLSQISLLPETGTLTVRLYDKAGNLTQDSQTVRFSN